MVFVAPSPLAPMVNVTVVFAFIGAAAVARTVTDDCEASSATSTFAGTVASVIVGRSSSVRARVVPVTLVCGLVPETPTVSSPSRSLSWVGVSVKVPVPVFALAPIVIAKSDTAA